MTFDNLNQTAAAIIDLFIRHHRNLKLCEIEK